MRRLVWVAQSRCVICSDQNVTSLSDMLLGLVWDYESRPKLKNMIDTKTLLRGARIRWCCSVLKAVYGWTNHWSDLIYNNNCRDSESEAAVWYWNIVLLYLPPFPKIAGCHLLKRGLTTVITNGAKQTITTNLLTVWISAESSFQSANEAIISSRVMQLQTLLWQPHKSRCGGGSDINQLCLYGHK